MVDMTTEEYAPVTIGGRIIGVRKPTSGQFEAMARIARTISRGTDDDRADFWMTQVDRLGTLLESLIAEDDRDIVDRMFLEGKIETKDLLSVMFSAWKTDDDADQPETLESIAKVKASTTRVRRK